jgi:protein phosphatase PTC7
MGKSHHFEGRLPKVPFPPESPIGMWRDKSLSRIPGREVGEDFFYVQDVRTNETTILSSFS